MTSPLLRLVGAVAIAGGLALAPTLASASTGARVAITSLKASSLGLQPLGGSILLTAVVTNAATCTISVSPPVAGFPQTLSCANDAGKSSRTLHVATMLPSNAKSTALSYSWSLVAKPQGGTSSVKRSIKVTVDGYSWGAIQQTLATQSLVSGLSCPTTAMCVMVAGGGYAGTLTSTGSHWEKVDNSSAILSVSCSPGSPVFCVAGDSAGNYLVLNGTTWSSPAAMPPAPGSGGTPDKVGKLGWTDCIRNGPKSSAKTCLLGDDTGHTYLLTSGGKITIRPERHDFGTRVAGVSCTSPNACVAVALNGNAIFFNGTSWSSPHLLDVFGGVTGVSCASNGACLLVDNTGSVVTFPSSGSSATISHNRHGVNVRAGSCVDDYCLVATSDGSFYQVVGSAWARSPKGYVNLQGAVVIGVSCALDKASPLVLSCTSIIQATASSKKGKDFKGHVTLLK